MKGLIREAHPKFFSENGFELERLLRIFDLILAPAPPAIPPEMPTNDHPLRNISSGIKGGLKLIPSAKDLYKNGILRWSISNSSNSALELSEIQFHIFIFSLTGIRIIELNRIILCCYLV